ncbi:MAG: M10 family metallopeptidase C-terminal domain-containing protein [Arsenophonus endosymbiont of Dermacentor nuttalli]
MLNGTYKNDNLSGGDGKDTLFGNNGDDKLSGGKRDNILFGGSGNDIFNYLSLDDSLSQSPDVITDFEVGKDKIDISTFNID